MAKGTSKVGGSANKILASLGSNNVKDKAYDIEKATSTGDAIVVNVFGRDVPYIKTDSDQWIQEAMGTASQTDSAGMLRSILQYKSAGGSVRYVKRRR